MMSESFLVSKIKTSKLLESGDKIADSSLSCSNTSDPSSKIINNIEYHTENQTPISDWLLGFRRVNDKFLFQNHQ